MVNRATLIGNIGSDPELRWTGNGKRVCRFSLATDETWRDAKGEHKSTTWHQIVCWEQLAERCGITLSKGHRVYIEGKIHNRKDADNRPVTEITADIVNFLSL